jgi:glycosyltransferase involved in cell wall biosynthesis
MSETEGPVPILVKVWAGKERHDYRYIRRSLPSLLASRLPPDTHVILVDDCSTDGRVIRFLGELAERDRRVQIWRNPENLGPNRSQAYNFPRIAERFPGSSVFVLCDDDVIYHADWLLRLLRVYREAAAIGLTGIFTGLNVPARPALGSVSLPTSEVLLKERQMALNWLVPRSVYELVGPFRDVGVAYDTDYANRLKLHGLHVVCLRPSYVQNIGYFGAYQAGDEFRAFDFVGRRDPWLVGRDLWFRLGHGIDAFATTRFGARVKSALHPILRPVYHRLWGGFARSAGNHDRVG